MLADPAQTRILDDIRASFGADPDVATFWIPITHPDASERGYQPQLRWKHEDFDEPDPPYEAVTFELDPTAVEVPGQPTGYAIRTENVDDPEIVGEVAEVKGANVYDVLNITVTAKGIDETTAVSPPHEHSAGDRASGICRLLYKWFREEFDESEAAGPYQPPVLARPISGRGPQNVTEQIERDGSQFTAGVELHYVDTWREYYREVRDADISISLE